MAVFDQLILQRFDLFLQLREGLQKYRDLFHLLSQQTEVVFFGYVLTLRLGSGRQVSRRPE